jgi:hypothetical protein
VVKRNANTANLVKNNTKTYNSNYWFPLACLVKEQEETSSESTTNIEMAVAAIPTSTQNCLRYTNTYSTPVAAIPTSTQRQLLPYLHLLKRLLPYLHLLNASPTIPTSTQYQLPPYLHLLKKRQEPFPTHEIGRIDGGKGFQTGGKVFQIGQNTFYNQKSEIPMKSRHFKSSGTGIIPEFYRIPCGFPNQGVEEGTCHGVERKYILKICKKIKKCRANDVLI